ncbi:hypothetical protein [Deinococcus sedimenti]|uniref:Uncharacterized protein n=1 Tax=Deinococcus sedimenti TaxID=1867090 RepID=A0ABQ2S149_9DEIO|nr:hypothetical protein [Deinococcus sedimenti]GGR86836.1 hypothetical protein GCM10008960_12520 [Deinococcus sedimenti]
MRPWMLTAPQVTLIESALTAFQAAWDARDPALLPPGTPRWLFLRWLQGQGVLFHGSPQPGLTEFEPRTPHDRSADEFSKRNGVFATSDALWALMYALRDRRRVRGMLNAALQVEEAGGWSDVRYFLSLAPQPDATVTRGEDLLTPGVVYVLPPDGFDLMPPYDWPGLGRVREPHLICPHPVRPLLAVPVTPGDFPLPVRLHDAATVNARCAADPWGFPWLD